MRRGVCCVLLLVAVCAGAAQGLSAADEGRQAVLERREMRRVKMPAPGVETGTPLVMMNPEARARVQELLRDQETLAAAKELVSKVRANMPDAVKDLTDAKILEVADEVLNTSKQDTATAAVIGALIGAAAAGGAVAIGRSDDKEDGKDDGKEIGGRA